MMVLVACEESQVVTKQFRLLGHEAYSCDIIPTSGSNPEWHLYQDVTPLLDEDWDMIIAFPPCTHLAVSGAAWFKEKIADGRQQQGIDFFMKFANAKCDKIAIENPIGIMSEVYRKPDQIIHPYYFGDSFSKSTCLWLRGLKQLVHIPDGDLFDESTHVDPGEFVEWVTKEGKTKRMAKWYNDARSGDHGHKRSKTFPGIARAMAEQWSNL